jgi:hypothetical protein
MSSRKKRSLVGFGFVLVGSALGLGILAIMTPTVIGEDLPPTNTTTTPNATVPVTAGLKIADLGKTVHIEPPTKAVVATKSATVPTADNPKVKPGLVKWHKDFAEACAASKKSGKPVFLFHMMGKLDDQFC